MLAKGLPKIPYRFTTQGFLQVGFWFPAFDLRTYQERVKDVAARKSNIIQAASERQLKALTGTHGTKAGKQHQGLRGENMGLWNR